MNIRNEKEEELKEECFDKSLFTGIMAMLLFWVYFTLASVLL